MTAGLIRNAGIDRVIPPPLPPDGGGFWYLRRACDAAILLDDDGEYVRFDSEAEARQCAAEFAERVTPKWMPKLRSN